MAGLFGALSSTAGALDAQQVALEAVGQNLANVNTPGYARREVLLAEVPPGYDGSGGGATVQAIQASRDAFMQQRLFASQPQASAQSTISGLLDIAQAALGSPGASLDADLSSYFDAWSTLANNPASGTARQGVAIQAQALAGSFRQIASQLGQVSAQADRQVRSSVSTIATLTSQIASLNANLVAAGGRNTPPGQTVQDQLYATVNALSNELDISVLVQSDGELNISFANGRALVVGAYSYAPTTGGSGANATVVANDGTDVTSLITGGKLGGALTVRDSLVPAYLDQLDTLAYTVVQQTNAQHAAGFDLNGAPGGDFFTPLASASGAATLIALDPGIAADPTKIAAAGAPDAGDNQNARAMANLANQAVLGPSTMAQTWGNLVYHVGQDAQVAQTTGQTYDAIVKQLQTLNDATSGVSIDDEAATLLKFQRAYQANARMFSAINDTIDTLFNMVGRA
jgi:flagellar hook-associated protein 1 FlgK